MKKTLLIIVTTAGMLGLSSCSNYDTAAKNDAGTGALLGGALGGVIGHQSGRGLEGAALGAGVGGVGGYAVGNEKDKRRNSYYHR